MVYPDQLPDPKAAKVLKGFDVAEPGDWIQELHWCWRETLTKKTALETRVIPGRNCDSETQSWLLELGLSVGLCLTADLPRSPPRGCQIPPTFLRRQHQF